MATKKKKKKPAPRKKTARKRVAKHAKKRARKGSAKRTRKKAVRRTRKKVAKRTKKRPVKRARKKAVKRRTVKRKRKRPVRRKTARKPARKAKRKTARKAKRKTHVSARKARPAKRKPARKKKLVRRFPKAPAAAARKPVRGFTLRRLAARLGPILKPPVEAYSGTKPYIFASYSHKNIKEVFWCIKKLAESRFRIWYDEGIEPGNEWPEEVGRALTGCQLFLVFMSPAAMESRNVRNEINFASSENKNMMVVMIQPAGLSEGMQLQIGTVQFVNKHEMTDTEFLDKMKKVLDPALRM